MNSVRLNICAAIVLVIVFSKSTNAQSYYEIRHDTISAYGWFGGDDRTGSERNVGTGQGVLVDTALVLDSFSFYFDSPFDYIMSPDGFGHEVTLRLNIRDALGSILQTEEVVVPDTFESGWVTWEPIGMSVDQSTLLIFTAYLVGAYDLNEYTSSQGSDQYQLYQAGLRYGKDGVSDMDMENWTDWGIHPSWDSAFILEGTTQLVAADDPSTTVPRSFLLLQNYPNPFNSNAIFEFHLPALNASEGQAGIGDYEFVSLVVYDVLGAEIASLVGEKLSPGTYTRQWDATGQPGGVYFYRLTAGNFSETRKLVYLP